MAASSPDPWRLRRIRPGSSAEEHAPRKGEVVGSIPTRGSLDPDTLEHLPKVKRALDLLERRHAHDRQTIAWLSLFLALWMGVALVLLFERGSEGPFLVSLTVVAALNVLWGAWKQRGAR